VGAPYEAPTHPDIVLGVGGASIEQDVERVVALLVERGLLPVGI
jgi:adenylylsulfate kinase-like enzyme